MRTVNFFRPREGGRGDCASSARKQKSQGVRCLQNVSNGGLSHGEFRNNERRIKLLTLEKTGPVYGPTEQKTEAKAYWNPDQKNYPVSPV